MPRMSIYLPDNLVAQAKEFDEENNMSRLIQTALRRHFGGLSAPAYVQRPADAAQRLRDAHEALAPAARAEYEAGYAAALRRVPDLTWDVLDDYANQDFDLRRWLDGVRNGISQAAVEGGLGPQWCWNLAEDLGSVVDPIGFPKSSFRPTRAFQRGYADALREVYSSVEHGTAPDWAGPDDSTSSRADSSRVEVDSHTHPAVDNAAPVENPQSNEPAAPIGIGTSQEPPWQTG